MRWCASIKVLCTCSSIPVHRHRSIKSVWPHVDSKPSWDSWAGMWRRAPFQLLNVHQILSVHMESYSSHLPISFRAVTCPHFPNFEMLVALNQSTSCISKVYEWSIKGKGLFSVLLLMYEYLWANGWFWCLILCNYHLIGEVTNRWISSQTPLIPQEKKKNGILQKR